MTTNTLAVPIPVSALMITTNRRFEMAMEAVSDFRRQSYHSRYLLVVTNNENALIEKSFRHDPSIICVNVKGKRTLGELRNIALSLAPSDWTMQWDDDDWYHPERIAYQVSGIQPNSPAVLFAEQLHYHRGTGQVAWVTRGCAGIEGTILYNRTAELRYPDRRRGEDTVFVARIRTLHRIAVVAGGTRYCRTYHGANTWGLKHHLARMRQLGKPVGEVLRRWHELQAASVTYRWAPGWKVLAKGDQSQIAENLERAM